MTEEIESCCGDLYKRDAVRLILGDSWHPGGLELTGRLAHQLGIGSGDVVVDLACGIGTSASFLASKFGCHVIGLDRSQDSVIEAARRSTGRTYMTEFATTDSHHLPLADCSADAAVLECVLSTFSSKDVVLSEVARILKPGGKVGITDVAVGGGLPPELKASWLRPFCISDALSTSEYQKLIESSGFLVLMYEDRMPDAINFIENIRKKLFVAQMLAGIGKLTVNREDLEQARHLLSTTKRSVEERKLGYALFIARKRG